MFNILCFHASNKSLSEDDIIKFYRREKSLEEKQKEDDFEDNTDLNLLESLTARDIRIIERSEEELSQTERFDRLLPSQEFSRWKETLHLVFSDWSEPQLVQTFQGKADELSRR